MPDTKINGVDLYYEIHGTGLPLMLVAGLASDSQSWQPVIGDLSRHCRTITPDNRGAGRTKPQDGEISIERISNDCTALVDHLGLSSVNLLGHSMGGLVALDFAIRSPERVNKLILAGTSSANSKRNNSLFSTWAASLETGMAPELWFRNIFFWLFSARFFENAAAVNTALRYAVEYPYPQSPIAFRNQIKAIERYDCTERLSAIAAKTMVISAKQDLLFPTEVCIRIAQAIPGAFFSEIANAAHSMHIEQPQVFTECVLDFLLNH